MPKPILTDYLLRWLYLLNRRVVVALIALGLGVGRLLGSGYAVDFMSNICYSAILIGIGLLLLLTNGPGRGHGYLGRSDWLGGKGVAILSFAFWMIMITDYLLRNKSVWTSVFTFAVLALVSLVEAIFGGRGSVYDRDVLLHNHIALQGSEDGSNV
jgi:hypothetical protein